MPSNLERKARRKRQTRLTFDPVATPSPHEKMSPANVRYEMPHTRSTRATRSNVQALRKDSESDDVLSSSKKYNLSNATSSSQKKSTKLSHKPLPTPAKSSQPQVKLASSLDSFDGPEAEGYEEIETKGSCNFRTSTTPFGASSNSKLRRNTTETNRTTSSSDGSEPEEDNTTPSKQQVRHMKAKTKSTIISLVCDTEEEAHASTGGNNGTESLHIRSTQSAEKSRRRESDTSPDSEDEESPLQPSQRRTLFRDVNRSQASSLAVSSSQRRDMNNQSNSDSDDDLIVLSQKPSQHVAPITHAEDSDSELVSSPVKRARRTKARADDSDSDIVSSPLKRRRPNTQAPIEENDSDSPSPTRFRSQVSRASRQQKTRRHRTEKEKMFELLRRRKGGEKIDELTQSDFSEEGERDDELQVLSDFDDEDEEDSPGEPQKTSTEKHANLDANSEDIFDFIVEDDEEPLGVPDHSHLIPLQFTHNAHKKHSEHFRDVVEWMVHNKTNPGFSWEDPVYVQAFDKLDNEYRGYAGSKFVSSQWTQDFAKALKARPMLYIRELEPGEVVDALGLEKCEVCNHRNHKSTFAIQFGGKAYHNASLEEVASDDSDSDDSDDDDDKRSMNSKGLAIPPENKQYFSGRICKENAEQAHTLLHWKWALNDWVVQQLEQEGYLTPEKLTERDKMKGKARYKYANAIVDKWQADGQIKGLYRDFKSQLETARAAKGTGTWRH